MNTINIVKANTENNVLLRLYTLKPVLCFHHGQCTTPFHNASSRYLEMCEERTQSCCLLGAVSLSCLCCCAVYSKLLACEHLCN